MGRVFEYRGGREILFRYESVLRFLDEKALLVAAGSAAALEEIEAFAPGHFLPELLRLRQMDPETVDPVEFRAALRRIESAGPTREEVADLHLTALAREVKWDEYAADMRRLALGSHRSLIDHPRFWRWLGQAAAARARPGDFREVALAAASGPLGPESRGVICDVLLDQGEIETAVSVLERWMRPGEPLHPDLARRAERIRALRPGRGGR